MNGLHNRHCFAERTDGSEVGHHEPVVPARAAPAVVRDVEAVQPRPEGEERDEAEWRVRFEDALERDAEARAQRCGGEECADCDEEHHQIEGLHLSPRRRIAGPDPVEELAVAVREHARDCEGGVGREFPLFLHFMALLVMHWEKCGGCGAEGNVNARGSVADLSI